MQASVNAMPDPAFWRDKSVLVTGHTGFKGAWLAIWLRRLGANVHGLALDPPTEPNLYDIANVGSIMASDLRVDINDAEVVKQAIGATRPEVVLHLAAQPLVRLSYQTPLETFATNVMGTAHIMDALRGVDSIKAAVIITTDKVYENPETGHAFTETDQLGGFDPYSASKAASEIVIQSYARSFFSAGGSGGYQTIAKIASARAGNVIGGGDWAVDRLVPDCLRAFAVGEPVVLRNPQAVRPWQHVLTPLHGYLLLAERLAGPKGADFEGAWNFSPSEDDTIAVGQVASRLAELWDGDAVVHLDNRDDHPHEAGLLRLDSSKARNALNWNPALSLEATLASIVDWTKSNHEGADMAMKTNEQIAAYQASSEK